MIRLVLISFSAVFIFTFCSHRIVSEKIVINDLEMLYGPVSIEQLYFDYPEWLEIEKQYIPDSTTIDRIAALKGKFEVKIFLATWCSDSRREVPRFMKIIESADLNEHIKIKLWAVDRKLHLKNNLVRKHKIERVATFIFYQNEIELGRIIESPDALLLEQDVYSILSGNDK